MLEDNKNPINTPSSEDGYSGFSLAADETENAMDVEDDKIQAELDSKEDIPEFNADLVQRIVSECCGKDDSGMPKAAITVSSEMWSTISNASRSIAQQSSNKPTVQIYKHFEFVQIDLKFMSYVDNDLKVLWNTLEKYGTALNSIDGACKEVPFLSLTIVPLIEQGSYYIICTNPVFWALQPERPGQYANTIRLYFRSEDMGFYESDDIDMNEIEASAQRAIQQREMTEKSIADKQEERAQYEEQKNARIEEMRRNGQL
jgi:hypothetical protein